MLLLAALVLTAAAWLRSAEYDEQYTLFLTAGTARPVWPVGVFPAAVVASVQAGHATLSGIAHDLRATDVHPPLYFWVVSLWRLVFGPGLFAARMLSVLCGVASVWLVGLIARRCKIQPALAMLITLGCYGFVYTNSIARGFAPAQMLMLGGLALLLRRRGVWGLSLAGLCLGAACCCNYLTAFGAAAAIVATGAWMAIPAMLPFLAVDAWFFAVQHGARPDQFPPFELWASLERLMTYETAGIFGGLPLYLGDNWQIPVQILIGSICMALLAFLASTRPWRTSGRRMLLAAAVAPAVGLLLLGAVFNNTPIELRYLSFGLPPVALLAAGCLADSVRLRGGGSIGLFKQGLLVGLLMLQAVSILGLITSPRTMQPARMTAAAAATLVRDGIVLLPAGNDGVGVVGAFGIEASPALPLLLIRADDNATSRLAPYSRIALAKLTQDKDSSLAVANARAALKAANWRCVAAGFNVEVCERTGNGN